MKSLGLGSGSNIRRGGALALAIVGGSLGVGCGGQALIEEPDGPVALTGGARSTLGAGGAFSSASGGRPIFPGMGVGGTITNPGPMKGPPIPVMMPPTPIITPLACPAGRGDVALFLAGTIWGDANFAQDVGQMLGAPVQEVVKRMFSDFRAQQGLRKFTLEWFRLPEFSKGGSPGTMGAAGAAGGASVPQPSIDELMLEEGQRYVLWSLEDGQGSLDRLFSSQVSVLNERLATYYGVPHAPASGSDVWNVVDLSSQERFGILTRGFWLSRNPNVSRRGNAVMQDLLCTPIPPPPVTTTHGRVPPPQISYQALRQQVQDPSCQGCHTLIDPAGVAFEHFSGVGMYQQVLGNQTIDASGSFTHNFGSGETAFKFQGVYDYTAQLAASQDLQMCLVKKVAAYANLHTYGSAHPNGSPLDCALQNNFLAGASVAEAMRNLFSVLVPQ